MVRTNHNPTCQRMNAFHFQYFSKQHLHDAKIIQCLIKILRNSMLQNNLFSNIQKYLPCKKYIHFVHEKTCREIDLQSIEEVIITYSII